MNIEMKAAAQVIARAKEALSEGTATCPECGKHLYNHTVTPDAEMDALDDAIDDWEDLAEVPQDECEDGPARNQRLTRLMR